MALLEMTCPRMKIRTNEDDATKLVITTNARGSGAESAAVLCKSISEDFIYFATQARDRSTRAFPVERFKEMVGKMASLKNTHISAGVPYKVLEIVSSPVPPSEFFCSLSTELTTERQMLETKQKMFCAFLKCMDRREK